MTEEEFKQIKRIHKDIKNMKDRKTKKIDNFSIIKEKYNAIKKSKEFKKSHINVVEVKENIESQNLIKNRLYFRFGVEYGECDIEKIPDYLLCTDYDDDPIYIKVRENSINITKLKEIIDSLESSSFNIGFIYIDLDKVYVDSQLNKEEELKKISFKKDIVIIDATKIKEN